jgi:hypothetical protein
MISQFSFTSVLFLQARTISLVIRICFVTHKQATMNWEMISAVGQMLGAIGVIISIVYLAAQIRNQNKESQRAAMNVLTTHWSDLNRTLVENPEMAVLWLRASRSFDDLDAKSKLRVGAHLGRFFRVSDSLYLGVLDGTLDKRLWRGYERTLADVVAYPGFQTWWATRKHWHTDEFCALIDRHIQIAKPKIYDGYNLS